MPVMGRKRHRLAERRRNQGLSQEALAQAIGVDTSTVARWERGETNPVPVYRPRLADALKVSVEDVAEMLAEAEAATRAPAPAHPLPGHERLEGPDIISIYEEPSTNRRDALKLGPTLLVAATAPTADEPGAEPPVNRLAAAVLGPGPAAAEPASVETLAARGREAWQLRQLASYDALAELLPSLITQAESSVATFRGADLEQAVRVAVHTYNAASSLLKTVGDCHLALVAADRSVRLARTVDDPQLVAAALYRVANVLLSARRLPEATDVAVQAADLVEPGAGQTPRGISMWGGLLLTAAVACARAGQEPEAWQFLGEARAASRMLTTEHADMYTIFGPTNVGIHGVQVAVELGNGHDALRRAERIDPHNPPEPLRERRGQYLIDLAHAHVQLNDDATAAGVLQQAHQVAPQEVRLSRAAHGLVGIMLGRARAGAANELRELAEAIRFKDHT
jgi:transcriptional regulator with XRE-family HTH domain